MRSFTMMRVIPNPIALALLGPTMLHSRRIAGFALVATVAAGMLGGCSSTCGCAAQRLYDTGQAWQRNECNRLADAEQRARCMAGTEMRYDEYRRLSGAATAAP